MFKIKAIEVPGSSNQWIDALSDGFKWAGKASDLVIGYSFIGDASELQDGQFNDFSSWGWRNRGRGVMEVAMGEIENIFSLIFVDRENDKSFDFFSCSSSR